MFPVLLYSEYYIICISLNCISLNSQQRRFWLMESNLETETHSTCSKWKNEECSYPNGTSILYLLSTRLRSHCWKGGRDIARATEVVVCRDTVFLDTTLHLPTWNWKGRKYMCQPLTRSRQPNYQPVWMRSSWSPISLWEAISSW